jgi:phage/plasmid-associated DNA primase/DNA polymerase I-like protein with 3'-5' exonuclease and polymerase domains
VTAEPSEQPPPRTFADNVVAYAEAGWPCILPVPARDKFPPPVGFTGAEGRDTDPLTLVEWAGKFPHHSIALRMPEGVIGIDVDQYVKGETVKRGAETMAACIERWGPLPSTWTSTARGPLQPSGIAFYRVPARRYATKLTGNGTGDVEIIQRHHRYAVVWPSPHPGAGEGATYQWYAPDGSPAAGPPRPGDLAELPQAWVDGLAEGSTMAGPASASHSDGEALLAQLLDDYRPECSEVYSARLTATEQLSAADAGSRHDTMTARVHHLIQLSAHGHPGVGGAVLGLRDQWEQITAGEDRGKEFEDMLLTSARKAVTLVGQHQVPRDPCFSYDGLMPPAPAPSGGEGVGPDGESTVIAEIPRWGSLREIIGTGAFDPVAGLDQTLAEAVLERMYPALRYAYDANAWLLNARERWEQHGDLAGWAVAELAKLMPLGDPTADKESEAYARAKRRTRLMTNAGANAVSGKMRHLVAGGMHPVALALADLDSQREILWAGGIPYSLRDSRERPTMSEALDPSTPHLRTAGVTPQMTETPLWDAFTAAVWPDPELRAWALRVLSIAVTGYSDRALPVLLGETGRGKTQLVSLIMSVLGSYAHAADSKLLNPTSQEHSTIVYALKGRRLSFIDEAPSEARAGQERLKQLTGGGDQTAREMGMNPVTFRPTHTFVLTANDEPLLTDPAVRSRSRLIPCEGDPDQVFAARAAIGDIDGPAWRAEAPGVLAQLMSEAAAWLAEPSSAGIMAAPESIRFKAEEVAAEQDPVTVWVSEETEPNEVGTPSRELYQAFTASCLRNNLRRDQIPSETKWGKALNRLGYPPHRTAAGRHRPLIVRHGGLAPVTPIRPTIEGFMGVPGIHNAVQDQNGPGDVGSGGSSDGSVTGSPEDPASTNSQVNHSDSTSSVGSVGFSQETQSIENTPIETIYGRVGRSGLNPTSEDAKTGSDLQVCSVDNPTQPDATRHEGGSEPDKPSNTKTKRTRSPEAIAKAQAKSEAKRQAAIEAAAGPVYELPALVLRDGSVRSISLEDADALLATITMPSSGQGAVLTVDIENSGYPVGHADYVLRTVQLGNEHFAVVLDPVEHPDTIRTHVKWAARLHAHSAVADLVPLVDAGLCDLATWERMFDTVIPAKLADPEITDSDPGLKKLSAAVLGDAAVSKDADAARAALFKAGKWMTEVEVTTPVERSGWAQVDVRCETQLRYAASDVLDTAAIAARLPWPTPELLERERTVHRMVSRMAHTGFKFDRDRVEALAEDHTHARDELADGIRSFTNGAIDNPGSNDQVGAAFTALGVQLPLTDGGKPSVKGSALTPLAGDRDPDNPRVWLGDAVSPAQHLARLVLDQRHYATSMKLLLGPWRELVRRGDGRARATVYTLGADTGRMSCVRFNFQQVSREGGLRSCITADPGEVLISADFDGVELRVAAALSRDAALLEILEDPDRDLHWEVNRLTFGPQATKAMRYRVKRGVFGRIYGGGVGAISDGVGVDHPTAQRIIDAMDAITPTLTEWSRQTRVEIETGHTHWQAYSGRTIHLPKNAPHAGPNYKIQGTARELLMDALLRWNQTRWGGSVVLPVHDEIVAKVPAAEAQEATAALLQCMTTELNGVTIKASASEPSFAWADG